MTERSQLLRLAPLLMSLAACAAPSSFDGLTGGPGPAPTNELRARSQDPTLDAPRPVSPVSVSFVSTLRPTFSWKASAGSNGAVVEMCRTRACDGEDVRRLEVEGETITAPADLEPGVWFWRLYGMSKERVGTKPSATWEVVVRGPGAKGASDAPSGGMVDINGDGLPDLIVSSEDYDVGEDGIVSKWPMTMIWLGRPDGTVSTENGFWFDDGALHDPAIAGGVDTDGDGFTDIIRSFKDRETGEFDVEVEFGSAGKTVETPVGMRTEYIDWGKIGGVRIPGMKTVPIVREAGDVNGDGFGDVLVGAQDTAVVGLGSAKGTTASMPLFFDMHGSTTATALIGAFDADGDGLSDVAVASTKAGSPLAAGRGDRERIYIKDNLMPGASGTVDKALAIASGDFDGDGIIDLAATVPMDGKRSICFWKGTRDKLFDPTYCVPAPPNDATYGDRLVVGDLSGKGKDNLLVSAGQGAHSWIEIFEVDGESMSIDEIPMEGIGGKLTMMWPGRPGKARWATVGANGTAVLVFEGRNVLQSIPLFGGGDFVFPIRALR